MRDFGKYICAWILVGMSLTGCLEELDHNGLLDDSGLSEYVTFSSYMKPMTKSSGPMTYIEDSLGVEIAEWDVTESSGVETKAAALMQLSGKTGITMFPYTGAWTESLESWETSTNEPFEFDGNSLSGKNIRWSNLIGKSKLRVYAYAPYIASGSNTTVTGTPKLSYTVNADVTKQDDLIAAVNEVDIETDKGKRIALGYQHVLTGIKFRAGFDCKVNSIQVSGVSGKGDYLIGGSWTNLSGTATYTITPGKSVSTGDMITDGNQTLMLIPQTLGSGAKVTMNYTVGGVTKILSASLEKLVWEAGKMVTYTLYEQAAGSNIIYFDLAAGNVLICCKEDAEGEPTATNTYTGYVFNSGTKTAVTGTHSSSNIYYVYQTKANNGGTSAKPTYPAITYNGKPWADFIENNTSVAGVIKAWKSAAQTAGRTSTNNRIRVYGSNKVVNLTIDNIYSTYAERSISRTKAGIGFNAGSNSKLTITSVGDNRVSAIHYNGNQGKNNQLVFEGTGSLTVAAASGRTDFYNGATNAGETASNDTTFYDNHWCAAIGGNDSGEGNSCGVIINSGNLFAGTTKAENCTAIGAGGNDRGIITINGGTVTAVATTTGTAIGGGIGFNSAGGVGEVIINAGNVYAYNHSNRWDIPSSAIGGAGSSASTGTIGIVTINGGNIYAQSALGTAIGGGSSKTMLGGEGKVTITGGNIIAKSVGAYSGGKTSGTWIDAGSGIGGGTGCTGGSSTSTASGGNATITISGSPVILTGSIGGGRTGAKKGNIGTATIDISGGYIQAQFVMAGSVLEGADFTPPSFSMSGGLIRNSKVNDPDYYHIVDNGGAVYMEDGNFTMTGGMIMDCYGEYGGAIYIKKGIHSPIPPSFNMSGGEITKCYSLHDGGAVYLEDGTVKVSGTAKIGSCYTGEDGNGGAICIKKTGDINPSFTMSGGEMSSNIAASCGGALYLEGGNVTISAGNISGNMVTDGNGGAISINSGSFTMTKSEGGSGASISANSAISKSDNTGYGGGVYVSTSGDAVAVNILAGSIISNSSARVGGGICVSLPSDDVEATVTVGESMSGSIQNPDISSNITLLRGGGLYVNGAKAEVIINSGRIQQNSTVGYVDNPDVMNDGGMVTLNGGDVKSVDVTYQPNNGTDALLDGVNGEKIQKIVIDTNNKLVMPVPTSASNGYRFVRWNTRADGLGTDYTDGQIVKRNADLELYAIWELN